MITRVINVEALKWRSEHEEVKGGGGGRERERKKGRRKNEKKKRRNASKTIFIFSHQTIIF